jgi:hypothetical protein
MELIIITPTMASTRATLSESLERISIANRLTNRLKKENTTKQHSGDRLAILATSFSKTECTQSKRLVNGSSPTILVPTTKNAQTDSMALSRLK